TNIMSAVSALSPESFDSDSEAELQAQIRALTRALEMRGAELDDAHRHIADLEERLLKLKEYRRDLKALKEQKQTLRRSPERRIGQVLLAPYRLPEKLLKRIWKRFRRRQQTGTHRGPSTEYQKWFHQHRASADELKRMREQASTFASRPLISIIT